MQDVATALSLPQPTRDIARLKRDLFAFGYCLIERAIEGDALKTLQDRLSDQAAAERGRHSRKNSANPQPKNQWVGMLLNKGAVFQDLVRHPLGTELVAALLGRDYLISCVDAQIQHPGSGDMPLHTDQWWMPPPVPPGAAYQPAGDRRRGTGASRDPSPSQGPISAAMVANVMWMVSDFTSDNGATVIVPKSHLSGRDPDPAVPHPVPTLKVIGPAGTAFAFDGRLWHGASANTSNAPRFGLTTNYCAPQCRQLENYTRGMRPEVLQALDPAIRVRLGFKTWSSYGHTGDPDTDFTGTGDVADGILKPE